MSRRVVSETNLAARCALLRVTLKAFDRAIERAPEDSQLKQRRAQFVSDITLIDERTWLKNHLVELDEAMARIQTAAAADQARLVEMIRDRDQTAADLLELGDEPR